MMHPSVQILALVFAAAIGVALGTLGGGGSVLTVPVLVYLLGYDAKIAVPTSLGVVGAASAMGAIRHWRAGRIDLRVAVAFGLVTMGGSYAGARLATHLAGEVQLAILAVVTVVAALLMLRPSRSSPVASPEVRQQPAPAGRAMAIRQAVRLAPAGAAVGLLTGTVGVGGGFLIVPALVLWGSMEMPRAIGTSLLVITMNCAIGVAGYAGRVAIPWAETALFTAVAVGGAAAGAALVGSVPPQRLRQIFAIFLLGVGAFVMYRSRSVFVGGHALLHAGPATPRAAP